MQNVKNVKEEEKLKKKYNIKQLVAGSVKHKQENSL